ncbi:MAG: hypothetical protein ACK53L_10505, partial [Pirellulaceae bacterium]
PKRIVAWNPSYACVGTEQSGVCHQHRKRLTRGEVWRLATPKRLDLFPATRNELVDVSFVKRAPPRTTTPTG